MTLPIAILAGGLATRMRPLTERVPKVLLDVAGRPFAEHQLRLLRDAGITDVVFCVGYLGEMVEETLGDGSRFGLSIRYSYDGEQLRGTGGALVRALPLLGDAFLIMYGDSYLDCDYAAVARTFLESGKLGLMAVIRNEGRWDKSNVLFEHGRIVRYDKKNRTPDMRHIDYGLGALRAEALATPVADLADVYHDLSLANQLAGYEMHERFYEIGSPQGLQEAEEHISAQRGTAPRDEGEP
ncbi:MAG TPA: nucleotidyltransferase family protein [Thermoanaerobaculia bacterium]